MCLLSGAAGTATAETPFLAWRHEPEPMPFSRGGGGDGCQFCTRSPEMPPPPNRFAVRFATPPAALRPLDAITANEAEYYGRHIPPAAEKVLRKVLASVLQSWRFGGAGAIADEGYNCTTVADDFQNNLKRLQDAGQLLFWKSGHLSRRISAFFGGKEKVEFWE